MSAVDHSRLQPGGLSCAKVDASSPTRTIFSGGLLSFEKLQNGLGGGLLHFLRHGLTGQLSVFWRFFVDEALPVSKDFILSLSTCAWGNVLKCPAHEKVYHHACDAAVMRKLFDQREQTVVFLGTHLKSPWLSAQMRLAERYVLRLQAQAVSSLEPQMGGGAA